MIHRYEADIIKKWVRQYPVVLIKGPRQAGKTTLCRMTFPEMAYVSLETPDTREFAQRDPRGFLGQFEHGVVIDEIQRVPELTSYIQTIVDERRTNGLFILTGSQNFMVRDTINQSLAGRVAIARLLPFSFAEIRGLLEGKDLDELIFTGFFPRIYDQHLNPTEALGNYLETYVERDIRSVYNIKDLSLFHRFVKLCAGRIGALLNLTNLGNEVGVSHTTAREWLSLLEASDIVFLLPPHHRNYNKRITKSPKLYFTDVGLAAYLLDIVNPAQMRRDPLRGQLFENMIIIELLKTRYENGARSNLSFFRDNMGNEVDCILNYGTHLTPVEIKAGQTITADFFKGLKYFARTCKDRIAHPSLVYGGHERQRRSDADVYPYDRVGNLMQESCGS